MSQYGQIPSEMTPPRYGPIPPPSKAPKGSVKTANYSNDGKLMWWLKILSYVMLFIMFGVGALLVARGTHKQCSPQCVSPRQRALLAATIISTILLMGLLLLVSMQPQLFSGTRRFVVIGMFVILSVFIVTGWSLYGSTQGDPTCNCPNRTVRELNAVGIVTMIALLGMVGLLLFTKFIVN